MVESFRLAPDLAIPRMVNGMWQVAGARGAARRDSGVRAMESYHMAGLVAWDMADIYGPAESWYGRFVAGGRPGSVGLTKMVPAPGPMPYGVVRGMVERSAERMGVDSIDLVQFHWWDYEDPRYLDAADALARLVREGRVRHLGLTNFDTERVRELVERGIPVVSNQVQYSVLDTRPRRSMEPYCTGHGISLLCYGTLLGGLVSERYLGAPEPGPDLLNTPSLQKYKRMVDAWGGWDTFQGLLGAIREVAERYSTTMPCVAVRYVLDSPGVAAAIVGCRLGVSGHIPENLGVFDMRLDAQDIRDIESAARRGRDLWGLIGDCGAEYR